MKKKIYYVAINIALALLWAWFAYSNIMAFLQLHRFVFLLFVIVQTEFVLMLLIRKEPTASTRSLYEYCISILGSFFIFLYRPAANSGLDSGLYVALGDILVYIAVVIEIGGFLSLNRSAGIVPANRGVKTGGLYRIVRHPIYASSLVLCIGYFLGNPSINNLLVLCLVMAFQIERINREEKFLSQDPKYKEYSQLVCWKLIPFIY